MAKRKQSKQDGALAVLETPTEPKPPKAEPVGFTSYNINAELGRINAYTETATDLLAAAERQANLARQFDHEPATQAKHLYAKDQLIEAGKAVKQKALEIDNRLR